MIKNFKCMPTAALPYDSAELATKMIVKVFEFAPFLVLLPKVSPLDTLAHRTLDRIPGVFFQDNKCLLKDDTNSYKQGLAELDLAFNSPNSQNLQRFKLTSVFCERYFQIISRVKPQKTYVNFLGPISVSHLLGNSTGSQLLLDKCYRKLIIQALCVKALWVIDKIKAASPQTVPVIIFEDDKFSKYGDLKREYEEFNRELVVNLYSKIFQKLQEHGAKVALQCYEKCDWTIPIEAGVDIISFNAYDNPNNLCIISEWINEFLTHGGHINWAIIPAKNDVSIKALNIDIVHQYFIKAVEGLIESGVSAKFAYNNSTVSAINRLDKLQIIFAEKVLILSSQLARKIPTLS